MATSVPSISRLRAPVAKAPEQGTTPAPAVFRRRRRVFATAVAVVALLAVAIALALLGGGSTEPAPATGAAAVVPADALAYVHVSIDTTRPAVRRATALGARLPDYARLLSNVFSRLSAIAGGGAPVDYNRDIRPWLGKEAAFAVLDTTGTTAGSLIVLDVSRRAQAQRFLTSAGASRSGTYAGVQVYRYASGTELAFVRHYLALGQDASVRAAIDASSGRADALRSSPDYVRAAADEPADRMLDAYVSAAGVRRLLEPRSGLLGALGVLLDKPALLGSAISVSAASHGLRIHVHSALDPALLGLPSSQSQRFSPTLPSLMPAGSMLMLDVAGLRRAAPTVLQAAAKVGVLGRVAPLLQRLGAALTAEGVNVPGILSIFSHETVVAVGPSGSLIIVTRTGDEQAARTSLAELTVPLSQLFPGNEAGPQLVDQQVAGVTAHGLALQPGLNVYWAVFHGLVVISTSSRGIAEIASHTHALTSDAAYASTLSDQPSTVTSLLFLDFSQLLRLGEQTGLAGSMRLGALQADLEKVRAVGLHSTRGESDTTAELFLQIP